MMSTLLYSEMNQAVPGSFGPLAVGNEAAAGGGSYGECQVPSPSEWPDHCYSPQSFHSPQHLPVELEKVKEEPFSSNVNSPVSTASVPSPPFLNLPASPSSAPSPTHHGASPYGRPSSASGGHVIKKDPCESYINLADLLSENQNLVQQHQAPPASNASPPYVGTPYPDHPLLRGRLEDANSFQKIPPSGTSPLPPSFEGSYLLRLDDQSMVPSPQFFNQKMAPAAAAPPSGTPQSGAAVPPEAFKDVDEGLSFLESLVDVKVEREDEVSGGSSCGSPALPSPGGSPSGPIEGVVSPTQQAQQVACQRDILETVEILALQHNLRDVQKISDSLNIPVDPAQWSVEDVRAWLNLQASQLNLPPPTLEFWNYGGPSLLQLTEHQFRQLAPNGGELLYAKLEIWREALKSSAKFASSPLSPNGEAMPLDYHHRQAYASYMHQQHHHQSPNHHHHHQNQQVSDAGTLMLLSPHHPHHPHQQHHHPSGASSPAGAPSSSPPLPLVPTSVAQVSQQSAGSSPAAPSSPQQQGGTPGPIYLDDQCLDMTTLLQQSPPAGSPKGGSSSPRGSSHPNASTPQEDAYDSEAEEPEEETCTTGGSGRGGTHIHLWQFLKELLQQPQLYGSCIRWLDRQKGVFKIEDSVRVARLWGKRKNRPAMNYDKLSRSIRQYYKKGIMKKTERSQRLVYQFCHPYCL